MRNVKSLLMGATVLAIAGCTSNAHKTGDEAQSPLSASAQAATIDRCATLATLQLDQVEIVSAKSQAAKDAVAGANNPSMTGMPGAGPAVSGLAAFCRVVGRIHPEPGSDIHFEVWMPSDGWNGRMAGASNGGSAGSIVYNDLASAVRAGDVGVSTDTGHTGNGRGTDWAKGHPELVRDYGWRGLHLTTVVAKKLVASFYGRGPDHSYFFGCSNGGREALIEASRFPDDYDGVLAGSPAAVMTDLIMSQIGTVQAQLPPGAAIRPEQAKLLGDEVVKQCDASDGQVDGLVADPRMCKVDIKKLACGVTSSSLCFTPAQLAALRKIWAGPHNASGHRVAFGYPPSGAEVGVPVSAFGWDGTILLVGSASDPYAKLADGLLSDLPPAPIATTATFDFNKDPARIKAALSADVDAAPNLQAFFDRGGKVIYWHGWADPVIPPEGTLAFYRASLRVSGPHAKDSERLFMVPGVQHCFGGTGADVFGQIGAPPSGETPERSITAALQAWVENGRAPESLVGRRGLGGMGGSPVSGPERERLLCAYPDRAVLKPGQAPDRAASYSCEVSQKRG